MGVSRHTWREVARVGLVVGGLALAAFVVMRSEAPTCHPRDAEAALSRAADRGILRVSRPASLSNLLWVHVGPRWHALPLAGTHSKHSVDRLVRCAAQTTDEQGQPTWQAAYYDQQTGHMVALTSRRYGFRLKPASAKPADAIR